jgi:hypothetical protein
MTSASCRQPGSPAICAFSPASPLPLAKTATTPAASFGLFFADANILYVADEGDGYTGGADLFTHAAAQTTAGIQKWIFNNTTQSWTLAYVLQRNLDLGIAYTVNRYPNGSNPATNLPWSPATDGVSNITGVVEGGKVTLYGITSTISGNGDTGADPNRLVAVTDTLSNTDATDAAKEKFTIVRKADFAEVLRGVSFAPGTK